MQFITESELQELLKLSKKQTKALMRTSGFPSIKIGQSYRVELEKLNNWLQNTSEFKLDYSRV